VLEQGLALARALDDRPGMAHVLNNIGRLAVDLQELARASACSTESLALAREQGMTWLGGWALLNISRVAIEQAEYELIYLGLTALARVLLAYGRPSDAARLLGAREAMYEGTNTPVLDMDRADYDAALVAVRASLMPGAFTEAWALGRATPLHELVASVSA